MKNNISCVNVNKIGANINKIKNTTKINEGIVDGAEKIMESQKLTPGKITAISIFFVGVISIWGYAINQKLARNSELKDKLIETYGLDTSKYNTIKKQIDMGVTTEQKVVDSLNKCGAAIKAKLSINFTPKSPNLFQRSKKMPSDQPINSLKMPNSALLPDKIQIRKFNNIISKVRKV